MVDIGSRFLFTGTRRASGGPGGASSTHTTTAVTRVPGGWFVTKRISPAMPASEVSEGVATCFVPAVGADGNPALFAEAWERPAPVPGHPRPGPAPASSLPPHAGPIPLPGTA